MSFNKFIYYFVGFIIIFGVNNVSTAKIKCIQCNNKEQPDCLNKIENIKEECEDDKCVTYVNTDQYLYRDCSSKLPEGFKCENETVCKICNDKGKCNNELNFPKDNRIQCYTCSNSVDCLKGSTLNDEFLKYCPKFDDKCYTRITDDKTNERDCLSNQKDSEKCLNAKDCVKCETKKCNNQNGEIELYCYECNGNDKNCKKGTTTETTNCKINNENLKLCTKYYLKHETQDILDNKICYIKRNGNNVERGCYLKNKPKNEFNTLLEITNDKNNGKCLDDLNCFECLSKDHEKCKNDDKDLLKEFSKSCDELTTSCYRYDDKDGNIVRGCGIPKENLQMTSFCYENNCIANKIESKCYACDSEKDSNCATLKNPSNLQSKDCTNDDCIVKINEKGHTIRGCKKDILGDNETCDKLCYKCRTLGTEICNNNVFPNDRLQCYQCKNCNQIKQNDVSICEIYKLNDSCYLYANEKDDIINRGCLTDTDAQKSCDTAKDKCIKCENNLCNNYEILKYPKLKCIQCDSTNDNQTCKWNLNKEEAIECKNKMKFWNIEKCYTCNKDGNITRGCQWDVQKQEDIENCEKCNENGCNNESKYDFTCIRCRSDYPDEKSCSKSENDIQIKPSKCKNVITKENKGCFTHLDATKGVVIRGCLADFELKDRLNCLDKDFKWCKSCMEPNCNKHAISKGNHNKIKPGILSLFIALITFYSIFCFVN